LIWDLKTYTYPFALKMVTIERIKWFHDFYHWIFFKENIDLEFRVIFIFKKNLHLNNCKVDCIMSSIAFCVKLSFLKVYFTVLTQLLVVHVTSNLKKNLNANFNSIVGMGSMLKIENTNFSWYNLTTPMQSCAGNWFVY